MALLYPWATKEYLLWQMSLPQIILYYNLGIEIKYPKPTEEEDKNRLSKMSYKELKKLKEEMVQQGLIEKNESIKEEYRKKYGSID